MLRMYLWKLGSQIVEQYSTEGRTNPVYADDLICSNLSNMTDAVYINNKQQ